MWLFTEGEILCLRILGDCGDRGQGEELVIFCLFVSGGGILLNLIISPIVREKNPVVKLLTTDCYPKMPVNFDWFKYGDTIWSLRERLFL